MMPNYDQTIFQPNQSSPDAFQFQLAATTQNEVEVIPNLETLALAEERIWQGVKLERQNQLEPAIACYREAVALDPQSIEAHQILAVALSKQGKPTEASLYHRRSLALKQKRQLQAESTTHKLSERYIPLSISPATNLDRERLSLIHAPRELKIAKLYLEQALAYCEERHWSKAIATCQQALNVEPNFAEAYKVWGNILQRQGKTAEALGYYAKAVDIQPDMAEIYANLGSLYARKHQWEKAIAYYQQALTINPQCAGVYRNLAKICEECGEIDQAWEYLFQAFEIEPKIITAEKHFQLGEELWKEGKYPRSVACYRYAVTVNPSLPTTHLNLARNLEDKQQWEAAKIYYQQLFSLQQVELTSPNYHRQVKRINKLLMPAKTAATKRQNPQQHPINNKLSKLTDINDRIRQYLQQARENPASYQLQVNLGSLYANKQEWQAAIFHYQKALKLNPQCAPAYRNLSLIYQKTGDPQRAAAHLYRSYQLSSEGVSANQYFKLARVLSKQQQIERAIICYRNAIALNPQNLQFYLYLAKTLTNTQNWERVVDCYRQLIKLKPDLWEAHHGLGDALNHLERWEESMVAYERAIELNPRFSWSYNNLGDVLLKLNRWAMAVDYFRKAIALNPEFAWSYYNLGEVLGKLGKWDEAYQAYRRAHKLDPNLPNLDRQMGTALTLSSKGNSPQAIEFYQRAIANKTNNEEIYLQLIELNPHNYHYYLQFGEFLFDRQRFHEAIFAYHTSLELQPNELAQRKIREIQIKSQV
jgi:tetratricopeptide (TPR) repeat protein